jgi:hypothetical protein
MLGHDFALKRPTAHQEPSEHGAANVHEHLGLE